MYQSAITFVHKRFFATIDKPGALARTQTLATVVTFVVTLHANWHICARPATLSLKN